MTEERRGSEYKRQIDRIEIMLGAVLALLNGEGEVVGLKDKVNIMWSYRVLFIGVIVTNAIAAIIYVTKMFI